MWKLRIVPKLWLLRRDFHEIRPFSKWLRHLYRIISGLDEICIECPLRPEVKFGFHCSCLTEVADARLHYVKVSKLSNMFKIRCGRLVCYLRSLINYDRQ